MSTQITIHPLADTVADVSNPSPHQVRNAGAPDLVNNDFFASLSDALDALNPLEHLPIISTIYHQLTGNQAISPGAKIAGDTLYGGPIGLIASIADSIFSQETGKNFGASLFAAVTGKYEDAKKLDG